MEMASTLGFALSRRTKADLEVWEVPPKPPLPLPSTDDSLGDDTDRSRDDEGFNKHQRKSAEPEITSQHPGKGAAGGKQQSRMTGIKAASAPPKPTGEKERE
jgi:hypothetical protein